jgi:glycogen(starch) synthase
LRLAHCVRAVFPQHGYGGLERAGAALTRHLLKRGVDVALFTRPLPPGQPFLPPDGPAGHLTVHGVRYGRLPLRPNGIPARLTNYRSFVEDMGRRVEGASRRGLVDGIYAQGLCAWGVRLASEWGVPLVANPQGMEDFKVSHPLKRLAYAPFRAWVRAGCRAADRVIATDEATCHEVRAFLGVEEARVVVIPNGVDVEEVRSAVDPAVRARLVQRWPGLHPETRLLRGISVGRLEANKGFEYLLRAMAALPAFVLSNITWLLIGEGSLRRQLEKLASELGIAEYVIFTGQVSDEELHALYSLSNLFVHPTLYEGSSLVTLEAMAHGLPVVASAVGGIPDKVVEGRTGFLVSPGDQAALAARIAWMLTHEGERAQMGALGARLAEQKFSWREIAAQTEMLFALLLDEKAACRADRVLTLR